MPSVQLRDAEIHYEISGDGPPLLLIAGLGQSSWAWTPVLPALNRCYTCIALDNRGTGQSSVPTGPYTIEQMGADVAGLLRHLDLGPVAALGWSLGASVLQALLIDDGSLVERAVLLSAFPSYTEAQQVWLQGLLGLRDAKVDPVAVALVMMSWSMTPSFLADHARAMRAARAAVTAPHPTSDDGFAGQASAIARFDARDRLGRVATPTLVLVGAEDALTPVNQSEDIARRMPNGTLHVLPRGSHGMLLEYPDEVLAAITAYLDGARVAPGLSWPVVQHPHKDGPTLDESCNDGQFSCR